MFKRHAFLWTIGYVIFYLFNLNASLSIEQSNGFQNIGRKKIKYEVKYAENSQHKGVLCKFIHTRGEQNENNNQ